MCDKRKKLYLASCDKNCLVIKSKEISKRSGDVFSQPDMEQSEQGRCRQSWQRGGRESHTPP